MSFATYKKELIHDLGEQPGSERNAQAGDTADDLRVGVGVECGVDLGLEPVERGADRVELTDPATQLHTHGLLDRGRLSHVLGVEVAVQPGGLGVDAALAAGLAQQRREPAFGQRGRVGGRGRCGEDHAAAR